MWLQKMYFFSFQFLFLLLFWQQIIYGNGAAVTFYPLFPPHPNWSVRSKASFLIAPKVSSVRSLETLSSFFLGRLFSSKLHPGHIFAAFFSNGAIEARKT